MRSLVRDPAVLGSVSVQSLHAYLKAQQWTRTEDLGDRGVVYHGPNEVEVFAPGSRKLADYVSSVAAVLESIAKAEDRSASAVLRDLHAADHDLIRFRAPEAEADGSITLESGVELVQQSRDALLAAACSASSPRRAFRAGGNKEASDYLQKVRLGQTEQGSFVVALLSPVPPALEQSNQSSLWPELAEEPFERKVTRTFSEAVRAVRHAISDVGRGSGIEAFERVVENGVSANLCDALAKLIGDGDGLDVSLSWAQTRPTPERRHREVFQESEAETLREAARLLREKEPRPNERLEGFVTRLARGPNAKEGAVTLKALVDDTFKSVRVDLAPQLYADAVKAHNSRQRLSVEGDLERQGQRWRLNAPRHLQTLPDDDSENDDV